MIPPKNIYINKTLDKYERAKKINFAKAEIKRANTRIVAIAKTFGTTSKTYQNAVANLMRYADTEIGGKPIINMNSKYNVPQLSTRTEILETAEGTHAFYIVKNTPSITKLKEKLVADRPEYKQAPSSDLVEEIERHTKRQQDFNTFLSKMYELLDDEQMEELMPELFGRNREDKQLDYGKIDEWLDKFYDSEHEEIRIDKSPFEV